MRTAASVIVLVLVGLLGGVAVLIWRGALPYVRVGEDVPLLRTPEWVPVPNDSKGGLLVLSERENDSVLLLKRTEQPEVYQYQASTRRLAIVPSTMFERSKGDLRDCGAQPAIAENLKLVSGNLLRFRGRQLRASGQLVVEVQPSPTRTRAAVVSAAGPLQISVHPFASGGDAWGQHYHQIVSLQNGDFVGSAVRLPFTTAEIILNTCWTPHERHVIYYDTRGSAIAVVPVESGGAELQATPSKLVRSVVPRTR